VGYAQVLRGAGVAETVQTMAEMLPVMKKRLGLLPPAPSQGARPPAPLPF
jgi:hypothetical protein